MPALIDPWFDTQFVGRTTATGHDDVDTIDEADGVFFWCPCGYGKPEFPIDGARPHGVLVSFANPRQGSPAPADAGSQSRHGGPSRWTMNGTGLADLTLAPSIDVQCWHGWIQNGQIV